LLGVGPVWSREGEAPDKRLKYRGLMDFCSLDPIQRKSAYLLSGISPSEWAAYQGYTDEEKARYWLLISLRYRCQF
jgi:hypothetical protein